MGMTLVRYRVKEGRGDENQALVEAVFAELSAADPQGLRYGTLRLDDGVSFVHIASIAAESNPLIDLASFKAFTEGLPGRCVEPPVAMASSIVGNHRLYA